MQRVCSILIPAYNEHQTIAESLGSVLTCSKGRWQVVVIDDGSSDETLCVASNICQEQVFLLKRPCNGGKTAAVLDGLEVATGDYVVVQDADLEYSPADIPRLLQVAMDRGGVVYGRRPSL